MFYFLLLGDKSVVFSLSYLTAEYVEQLGGDALLAKLVVLKLQLFEQLLGIVVGACMAITLAACSEARFSVNTSCITDMMNIGSTLSKIVCASGSNMQGRTSATTPLSERVEATTGSSCSAPCADG